MGESEGSVFWTEQEDFYEETELEYSHHCSDDQESSSKRVRHSPQFHHQEGDAEIDSFEQSSPLGLKLRKTPSFLSLVQSCLSTDNRQMSSSHLQQGYNNKPRTKKAGDSDKLKASNFPATLIKIGSWQRATRNEGDLTAKLYYAKRKLVWEVLDGALKSKIEIQWCDITAIRAVTSDINQPGTLEIELNQPPMFYREINPQPRKHTLWTQASDFTGGQAPIWRRHVVRFPPGVLDKHYEKLLQYDQRLFALSQKPFPSHESPYFDPNMFGISQLSLSFGGYRSPYLSAGMHYPNYTYPTTAPSTTTTPLTLFPNSTSLVTELPYSMSHAQTGWGSNVNEGPFSMTSDYTPAGGQYFDARNYQPNNLGPLDDIENHLLGESSGVNVTYNANANCSDTNYHHMMSSDADDQLMQYARYINPMLDGHVYPEMMPPQQYDDNATSLAPFVYPDNPTDQDFF